MAESGNGIFELGDVRTYTRGGGGMSGQDRNHYYYLLPDEVGDAARRSKQERR